MRAPRQRDPLQAPRFSFRLVIFGPSAVAKGGTSRKSRKWDDYALKDIGVSRQQALGRRVSHFGDRNDL